MSRNGVCVSIGDKTAGPTPPPSDVAAPPPPVTRAGKAPSVAESRAAGVSSPPALLASNAAAVSTSPSGVPPASVGKVATGSGTPSPAGSSAAAAVRSPMYPWKEAISGTGERYFYNVETQETSWVLPKGLAVPVSDKAGAGTGDTETFLGDWKAGKDPITGKPYFYNPKTGQSSWEAPIVL